MVERSNAEVFQRLARKVGPNAVRFVEFATSELWQRARATALAEGFDPLEAEQIARVTAAGAVKGIVSAMSQTRHLRQLRTQH